jgi:signal peptidase I
MVAAMRRPVTTWLLLGLVGALSASGCGTNSVNAASRTGASAGIGSILGFSLSDMYKVPSGSMEPTLPIGTRVTVERRPLHVGAIVVFHPPRGAREQLCGPTHYEVTAGGAACDQTNPAESSEKFIKRVVAGPGDTITIRAGHVYRNGVREQDPYIAPCASVRECNFPTPIKISAGHWFLLGDNRGESDDSRFWGPVPQGWILGTATYLECPRFRGRLTWVRRTWREGCRIHTGDRLRAS